MPPLVLVLDERGVGPLHDGEPEVVRTGSQVAGDVELGGEVGVLAQPDLEAVDRHDDEALGRADREHDPAIRPSSGTVNSRSYTPVGLSAGGDGGRPANGIWTFV